MINVDKLNQIQTPTPFLAIDLAKVRKNYRSLKKLLPEFEVYYAMKSNPEEAILMELDQEGCHFEIASIGELERLKKIGVNPSEVIFSNPVKISSHIKSAYEAGVRNYAVDSMQEVLKIAKNAPGSDVYARVSVSNHGSVIDLSYKFGAQEDHVVALMGSAQEHGLNPSGLAFHVGSQAENIHLWDAAIETMGQLIARLENTGIHIKTLNVGGGVPIRYIDPVPNMVDIAKRIKKNIKDHIPAGVQLICEPGRAIIGDAGVIASEIIGIADRNNRPWLYLDTGRFQSFVEMFESDALQYPVFTSLTDRLESKSKSYTLTGPTCDSYDTIMNDVTLPSALKMGDRLYFGSAGAYTHVYGSAFNDFPVPVVVYEEDITR